jgi:hypothetical protein
VYVLCGKVLTSGEFPHRLLLMGFQYPIAQSNVDQKVVKIIVFFEKLCSNKDLFPLV